MGFASLFALRAAVISLRQNGHGVMWAPPGTNATLATNPYLGPWAPQVPGMMGPWGAAASQQIIVSVDAMQGREVDVVILSCVRTYVWSNSELGSMFVELVELKSDTNPIIVNCFRFLFRFLEL